MAIATKLSKSEHEGASLAHAMVVLELQKRLMEMEDKIYCCNNLSMVSGGSE